MIDSCNLRCSGGISGLGLGRGRLRGSGSWGFSSLLLLGGLAGSTGSLTITTVGRGPEGQVVAQQLHDESAVAVRLLRKRIELGDSIIESLLGQVAGAVG
jgi:hypothetical protein